MQDGDFSCSCQMKDGAVCDRVDQWESCSYLKVAVTCGYEQIQSLNSGSSLAQLITGDDARLSAKESRARNLITVSAEICFQWEHGLFRFEVRQNSPVVTLWLTDELSESSPAYKHASLDSKQITWPCCFRKQQWSALGLYRSNREFNFTWIIVYFACLSGWSCLSSGERSTALREHCSSLSTIVSLFYHIKLISGLDVWSWVTVVFLHY